MLQSASEISPKSSNDKLSKRPRSHYSEMNSGQTSTSGGQKLDTSFESYFGVERSASNSDVVRIRVPYSRDDALSQLKKTNSQDIKNTNTTSSSPDQNKIRIRVPKNSDGTSSSAEQQKQKRNNSSNNGNNGTLEHEFNSKLVLKNHNSRHHQQHHHHANNTSNSKSMTNL